MSSQNQVTLIGHVANDVQETFQYLPTQPGFLQAHGRATVVVAVHRTGRSGQSTDFVACVFEGKNAENLIFAKKGDMICVYGTLRLDTVEFEGKMETKVSVLCHQYEFLGSAKRKVSV